MFIIRKVVSFVASCLPHRIRFWWWVKVTANGSKIVRRVRRIPDPPVMSEVDLAKANFVFDIMDLEEDGHITPRVSNFIIDLFNERMG